MNNELNKKELMNDPVLNEVISQIKRLQLVVRLNDYKHIEKYLKDLGHYCKNNRFNPYNNKDDYECYIRSPKLFLWFDDYLDERYMEGKTNYLLS